MWQWKSQTRISEVSLRALVLGAERVRTKERGGGLIWVVGAESDDEVSAGVDHEGVSAHGYRGEVGVVVGLVVACVFGAAQDGLEGVPVEMKGMAAGVVVVDDYFDDLVLLEDEWVGIFAVDGGVVGICATCKGCVKSGDFGSDVGDIVEECTGETFSCFVLMRRIDTD
jgi:hypothetical protein